jgi:hypothetical protein
VETTLLTEFHKWASLLNCASEVTPQFFAHWTPEVESVSDRLKNLEGH